MKTSKLLSAALALIIPSTLMFTGCDFSNYNIGLFNTINYKYDNADQYTAGDREITDKVTTINIDYISGDVVLTGDDTDKVTVKETANKALTEDQKVHTWVNDGTLYVRYCASKNGISVDKLEKSLSINVPGVQDLDDLIVHISSGSFNCSGITSDHIKGHASSGGLGVKCSASDIELSVSSGAIVLEQEGDNNSIDLDASSGNISLVQKGSSNSVKLHSSSGNCTADLGSVAKFDVKVSSGNIIVEADEISELISSSSSGNNEFRLDKAPSSSDIHASSGWIKMFIPEDSDIVVNSHISSGEFNYDLPFSKDGKTYINGNGTNVMNINSSSGDVSILNIHN